MINSTNSFKNSNCTKLDEALMYITEELRKFEQVQQITNSNLSMKNNQLEELREAYIYNLRLLLEKERNFDVIVKEHVRLTEQNQLLSNNLSGLEDAYKKLQSELSKEKARVNELTKSLEEHAQREQQMTLSHSDEIRAVIQAKLQHDENQRTEINRLKRILTHEREQFKNELEALKKYVTTDAEVCIQEWSKTRCELDKKLKIYDKSFAEYEGVTNDIIVQAVEKEQLIKEMKESLCKSTMENEIMKNRLNELLLELSKEKEDRESIKLAHEKEVSRLLREKQALAEELCKTKDEMNTTRKELVGSKRKCNELRESNRRLLAQLAHANNEIKTLSKSEEDMRETKRLSELQYEIAERQLNKMKDEINEKTMLLQMQQRCFDKLVAEHENVKNDRSTTKHTKNVQECDRASQTSSSTTPLQMSNEAREKQLKEALSVIQRMVRDREVLLQLSNRLNAKLRTYETVPTGNDGQEREVSQNNRNVSHTKRFPDGLVANDSEAKNLYAESDRESMSAIFKLLDENASNISEASEENFKRFENKIK